MERLLMVMLAIRLDFAALLVDDRERCERVASILTRPCFDELERVSAHRGDRWVEHAEKSASAIVHVLQDRRNRSVAFDTKRKKELVAGGEIQNGTQDRADTPTRFTAELVFPAPADTESTIAALVELATTLRAGAGFVACEPSYELAHHVALGGSKPKMRDGLSETRAVERRGRDWHYQELSTKLSGPEWGTFLSKDHLRQVTVEELRAAGVFHEVVATEDLAFLQLTPTPTDGLSSAFEERLAAARTVLAPVLMDLSDVDLR